MLLTRPLPQGAAFEAALRARWGTHLRLVTTPLMAPTFLKPALPEAIFDALIITSQTGIAALARLDALALALPRAVYCVGAQTARQAQAAGLDVVGMAPDAAGLIRHIMARPPTGKLLHLRGQDARGDIAKTLHLAGIDTHEAIIYAQVRQALTPDAIAVLQATAPVLVPLFSPRTATIFVQEMHRVTGLAPLFIAAISAEVAVVLGDLNANVRVAAQPDAASMIDVVASLAQAAQRA